MAVCTCLNKVNALPEETVVDVLTFRPPMPSVKGKLGDNEVKSYTCTFGVNVKGRMDNEEFFKYVKNPILPLYVNVQDNKGGHVIIKAEFRPGRTCRELLATVRHAGFILLPGVSNTTVVT